MAPSSRKRFVTVLKGFFSWCKKRPQRYVIKDPAEFIPHPDKNRGELPKQPLSIAEIDDLFDSLPNETIYDYRMRACLELMYGCGLRVSEVCALKLKHINFRDSEITAFDRKHRKDTTLDVMSTAMAALNDYLGIRRTMLRGPDEEALFLNQYGRPMQPATIYSELDSLNRARGPHEKHLTPHGFRHAIAHHFLEQCENLDFIKVFLDHKNLSTVLWYLKLSTAEIQSYYLKSMFDIQLDYGQFEVRSAS